MAYDLELFERWIDYYFPDANETYKNFARMGWRGKAHLDFMRSHDDKPLWMRCMDRELERSKETE